VASASLLMETVIGHSTARALEFFRAMVNRLTHATTGEAAAAGELDLGKLRALEGVREFPTRVKCATLAWHALHSALKQEDRPVSTE
jgi:nitrogen fixation NifU-like protein